MPIPHHSTDNGTAKSSIRKPSRLSNSSISKKPNSQSKSGKTYVDPITVERFSRAFLASSTIRNLTSNSIIHNNSTSPEVDATPTSFVSPAGATLYHDEMDIDGDTNSNSNSNKVVGLGDGADTTLFRDPGESLTAEQKQLLKNHIKDSSMRGCTDFGSTFYKDSTDKKSVESEISSLNPDIAHKPESVFKDKGKGRMVEEDLRGNGDSGGNAGSVSEGPEGAVYGSEDEMMIDYNN